ncbi:OmpA family protein [Anseongella ginsenosidimutans]|uniref:OmpA family protein n=1 Tax=Anseongella ginsenosidimutans TaxID=496056 RepID=A0A4R3KPE7_9SPHI|nr:OmpA family protein [Anseongella ginsenosidimutans]
MNKAPGISRPGPEQQFFKPVIQTKLVAEPTYPPYLVNSIPGRNPASDPASRLRPSERTAHVGGLLQDLCPGFQTDSSTGLVSPVDSSATAGQLAAGNNPAGCCCLHVLTRRGSGNWRILVSDVVSPHTLESEGVVVVPGPNAPIDYGNWTAGPAERRVIMSNTEILGHELCGHAALMELQAHPPDASRLTTDVHDPTVNIQNLIATEQGVPASDLRGLASGGSHRGESFARIVISGYPANRISPFSIPDSAQHRKLFLATNLIRTNDFFVNITGHTDPSGTDAINDRISLQRANSVKAFIAGRVPANRHLDRQDPATPLVNRFRSTTGVRDQQPPPAALQGNPDNWRRVEIFVASFPAATENAPAATPATVTQLPPPPGASALAASGDECEKVLVNGAYPGISATTAPPAISPALPAISPKRQALTASHLQRQEAEQPLSLDPELAAPPSFRPSASPDFLSMRQPFINRGVFDLWDSDSAMAVWRYNFDFFRLFGLSPGISTTLSNFASPRFIDAQLKLNNPTWWEITDLELNTSTVGASVPVLEFNADFSVEAPSWFRSVFLD